MQLPWRGFARRSADARLTMHDYGELFGAEGPLATAIPGFATREEQIAMAEQVALAVRSHGRLFVEAGTGTGKTFAYLVCRLLLEKKKKNKISVKVDLRMCP